ncbi:MAG TPA: pyridoxamine 5'-phosphate oxidase [Acetobacteraceae bacterium]|nr:pyridoxamine 5'-phosphate oxidase [Acetobacteraceae bacterium]
MEDAMADPVAADGDPYALFQRWMEQANAAEPNDPNAMTLATATPDGMPAARIVLLKGVDAAETERGGSPRGFVFYTNQQSRKGDELAANPRAALLFHWKSLRRQVRIEGGIEPVAPGEADAYFATRPRLSRIGAWASDQSRPLPDRETLQQRVAACEARYPGEEIPRPPHWSGYRLRPRRFEFWQDMPYRLHDRVTFVWTGGDWAAGRLFP